MERIFLFLIFAASLLFFAGKNPGKNNWSKIKTDPQLSDPFFEKPAYKHPWFMIRHDDGHWETTMSDSAGNLIIDTSFYAVTARCLVNRDTFSLMDEADARMTQDTLQIQISGMTASFFANFSIAVYKSRFTSAYSTAFIFPTESESWRMLEQELVLDKKTYKPGDEIRGRIRYTCLQTVRRESFLEQEPAGKIIEDKDTIRVDGVFKCRIR